jgi:hypothetical protein
MIKCVHVQDDQDPKNARDFSGGFRKRRLYSLLDVQEPEPGKRLLKLRDHYGKTKWNGRLVCTIWTARIYHKACF